MMPGLLYMVGADGELQRMRPSAPENEDHMQMLVARYPELISDGDGELLLIRREQAITDSDTGYGRWSLDHLFVTRDAVPVLVELKRAVDTRLRREVIGQMLDYAANATAYWQTGRIADSFAQTALQAEQEPEELLRAFLGDEDPDRFWQQVDANFKAGRIKLVFVADQIPRELARIVEFMNDQMRADVRAVELRWFAGGNGAITLSPRVIGETERAAAAKRPSATLELVSPPEWLERNLAAMGADVIPGAHVYMSMIERLGGAVGTHSSQGSIYASFAGEDGKILYPFHLWKDAHLSFTLRFIHAREGLQDESVRMGLLDQLVEIVGPLKTMNTKGYPAFPVALLTQPSIAAAVEQWMARVLDHIR